MEINGMLIDVERVKSLRTELKEAVDTFNEELHGFIGKRCIFQANLLDGIDVIPTVNFGSTKVLQDILFSKLGLEPVGKTKGGAFKTGKDVIDKYKYTVPFVATLSKYKIACKLLSSYFSENGQIMSNIESDGRVRASILDFGTVTGRMSVRAPALQTLPKSRDEFPVPSRAAFIAGKGRKMFTVDFSNQEGRITAHLSNDKTFIKQLENGWDAHLATANAAFSLSIPEDCLSYKHEKYDYYVNKYKNERFKAKSINFALPYGGTEFAISKAMGVSKEDALEAINKYYNKYKGIKNAMEEAKSNVSEYGCLTTMFGRKRHFIKVENKFSGFMDYPQGAYRQAFNFLVQSSSADMMRIALIKTRELFKANPLWDAHMEMTVHDEGVFTVKEEYLKEASKAVKHTFENCIKLIVPIKSDVGTGNNYEEAK